LFAPFFLRVQTAVTSSPNWHNSYRYYVDTKKGRLRVESEEEIWTLCSLARNAGKTEFIYDQDALLHFGLHPRLFATEDADASEEEEDLS
jgi:hypothetical protein